MSEELKTKNEEKTEEITKVNVPLDVMYSEGIDVMVGEKIEIVIVPDKKVISE